MAKNCPKTFSRAFVGPFYMLPTQLRSIILKGETTAAALEPIERLDVGLKWSVAGRGLIMGILD